MTRLPPQSVGYWTGELDQRVKPINELSLETLLEAAGAIADRREVIAGQIRGLPFATRRYRLLYDNGIGAGAAAEYTDKLLAVLRTLNELLADPAAGPVLGSASQQSLDAFAIAREFRRTAPLFEVVVSSFKPKIPPAVRGGSRDPQRQYLAHQLIDVFEEHGLDASPTPTSPMTRLYALLLVAAGEDAEEDASTRPDAALRKALKLRAIAQQRPD